MVSVQRVMTVMFSGVLNGRDSGIGETTLEGMAPVMVWLSATVL